MNQSNQFNGNSSNGHSPNGQNGSGNGAKGNLKLALKERLNALNSQSNPKAANFDQGVVLRPSPEWSRGIIWSIMGVTTFAIVWASVAKIEQVVPAQGQLKPVGKVKEIQAPINNGVVKEVYVKDGMRVKQGELLVSFDATASMAELDSQQKIRRSFLQENEFYRTLMGQSMDAAQVEAKIAQLKLPREVAALARSRIALVAENQLFSVQLGQPGQANLNGQQLDRLQANRSELNSRAAAAEFEVKQLERQLDQNQVKLADARAKLVTNRLVLKKIERRNQQAIAKAEASLAIDRNILREVEPLLEEGGIAKLQVENQRQKIIKGDKDLVEQRANGKIDYDKQQQEFQSSLAEIEQLLEEQKKLQFNIAGAREKLANTKALSQKETLDKMAENDKKIAEIDSQLMKLVVENEKQISQVDSKISSTKTTLKYQELRAPVSGTVFDLQAAPGFVPNPSKVEPVLKIVPDDHLVAEVFITNKDIGFVRDNMKADVRIDSFPFSEFGDIKGKVIWVGSDALPPDEQNRVYRFPARISLDKQALVVNGRDIPLQSGMSVSVNVKVREDRTVLSLFTELFTKKIETLKQVR